MHPVLGTSRDGEEVSGCISQGVTEWEQRLPTHIQISDWHKGEAVQVICTHARAWKGRSRFCKVFFVQGTVCHG